MIVADIHLTACNFSGGGFVHNVRFDDLAKAEAEYERVAALMLKRADRGNDLPKTVEVVGVNKITLPLDDIHSVALSDFAEANEQEAGVRDAFPNLFKR